ncbi:hypothetical protein [Ferruginibacter albus]|uniref:hypothetical protein n=1 Tax=Ferruginibacter albus TaxID=2875540 RepID=UPI001CC3F39F|nr:hypothetical protein [Ferruginibacter albus]UAY53049.1 hypothetical protein K9M53_05060 [Ferruginibacter albus]
MKQIKYLNGVLTVIAVCLVLITMAVTGIIPTAKAGDSRKQVTVPVNVDGSINVKVLHSDPVDVNISQVGGFNISSSVPVETKTPGKD